MLFSWLLIVFWDSSRRISSIFSWLAAIFPSSDDYDPPSDVNDSYRHSYIDLWSKKYNYDSSDLLDTRSHASYLLILSQSSDSMSLYLLLIFIFQSTWCFILFLFGSYSFLHRWILSSTLVFYMMERIIHEWRIFSLSNFIKLHLLDPRFHIKLTKSLFDRNLLCILLSKTHQNIRL